MDSDLCRCPYNLRLCNLQHDDVVTYPIIRLTGMLVPDKENTTCKLYAGGHPIKILHESMSKKIFTKNHKFKEIIELQPGNNKIKIIICHRSTIININYDSIPKLKYTILPLYIICKGHNGYFQAPPGENNDPESACKRIELATKLLQCVTADKIFDQGLTRKTFVVEKPAIFNSKLQLSEAKKMKQEELWEYFGREIMTSDFASKNRKYLGFLSCTKYLGYKYENSMKTHQDLLKITENYVALGGGGLALFGTACLYCWPENFNQIIPQFQNDTKINRHEFLDDSSYRGTVGGCYSTTLGSTLHELYHTFDLGHTEMGMMGKEYKDIYKFFIFTNRYTKTSDYCFHFSVEFSNDLIVKSKKPKTFNGPISPVAKKNEEKLTLVPCDSMFDKNDDTFLIKSAAVTLSCHKWLSPPLSDLFLNKNLIQNTSKSWNIRFDSSTNTIQSVIGLRVVELRSSIDEIVLFHWTFTIEEVATEFILPKNTVDTVRSFVLFVSDCSGNILKYQYKNKKL